MKKYLALILLTSLSLFAASFDCTKATTKVEKMICQDTELSQLDEKLSQIYSSFTLLTKEIKTDQRAWMKKRNTCQDTNCIKEAYTKRVEELTASLANQKTFSKKTLDLLKKSQEAIKVEPSHIKNSTFQEKEFFHDLFTFKNIKVIQPTLERVDYNNSKLKEMLGDECWNMHLEYSVGVVKEYEPAGESSRGVWLYEGTLSQEFSAWDVDMDGDGIHEVMFLQHFDKYEYYNIIDKALCKDFSFIPCNGDASACPDTYPDIYSFYDTAYHREQVFPFCTLEQKVAGRTQKPATTNENIAVFVVDWKGKSYLINVDENTLFKEISITVDGTQKLEYLCINTYILKNKKDNK